MTLIVELSGEQENTLRRAARQRGIKTEEYAGLLLERLAAEDSDDAWEADLDALATGSDTLDVLAPDATTREHIYESRG
jgi:hypothetical protein